MSLADFALNFLLTTASILVGIWVSFHFYTRQQSETQNQKYTEINQSLGESVKSLKELSAAIVDIKVRIEALDKNVGGISIDNDNIQREIMNIKSSIALLDKSTSDVVSVLAISSKETTSRLLDSVVLSKTNEKSLVMDKTTIRINPDDLQSQNNNKGVPS